MSKIIKIDYCNECNYIYECSSDVICLHPSFSRYDDLKQLEGYSPYKNCEIPHWCPLEDYKEQQWIDVKDDLPQDNKMSDDIKCVICRVDDSNVGHIPLPGPDQIDQAEKLLNNETIGHVCEKCAEVFKNYKFLERRDKPE